MANLNSESGRRGNWRYMYGTHGWVPERQFDFSRGFIRDIAQTDLPSGSLYDVTDFLVHLEGALVKRGNTAYAGPAMTAATYAAAVAYAEYPSGGKLIAVGDNGHIYNVTSGATTDLGGSTVTTVDTPKFRVGGTKTLLVFPVSDGTTSPIKYDGSAAPGSLGGTPPAGKYAAVYKSRLALAASSSTPNRVYFSPTPDIESTWDTTNAWVDFGHPITGLCALQNALLVFSSGHTERLVGSTPPPNSDMDLQPVGDIGCLDARSIAVWNGNCIFANGRGIYMTNGTEFVNLTGGQHGNDGITNYWQKALMPNYTAGSTVLAGGVFRDFYFLSFQNQTTLMCHIPTRAWTRFGLNSAQGMLMYASRVDGADELYGADPGTNRVDKLSGIFVTPDDSTSPGTDADGTVVSPSFTTKAFGDGSRNTAFGDAHLTYYMQGTSPPTLLLTYKAFQYSSVSGLTSVGLTGSPLGNSNASKMYRQRLGVGIDSAALVITCQQSGASTRTIIRGFEVDQRPYPFPAEGPSA